ncbi:hypothetical protein DIPPA_01391 [Diplonema papillatum]|nr:hypothetical protein DIPPA_01391 [Diplonema papillatum]
MGCCGSQQAKGHPDGSADRPARPAREQRVTVGPSYVERVGGVAAAVERVGVKGREQRVAPLAAAPPQGGVASPVGSLRGELSVASESPLNLRTDDVETDFASTADGSLDSDRGDSPVAVCPRPDNIPVLKLGFRKTPNGTFKPQRQAPFASNAGYKVLLPPSSANFLHHSAQQQQQQKKKTPAALSHSTTSSARSSTSSSSSKSSNATHESLVYAEEDAANDPTGAVSPQRKKSKKKPLARTQQKQQKQQQQQKPTLAASDKKYDRRPRLKNGTWKAGERVRVGGLRALDNSGTT